MIFAFFNLGFGEIFAIFVVVLLLFGADKIPEFARTLGKGIRYVKEATDNVKRDIQSSVDEVKTDIDANVKLAKENMQEVENVKRRVKSQVNDVIKQVADNVDSTGTKLESNQVHSENPNDVGTSELVNDSPKK